MALRRSMLGGCVVLGLAGATARAQPLAGGFQYSVSGQLADCPDRDQMTAQIGEMSRRDPPPPDQPLVEVSLFPRGEGVGATIRLLRNNQLAGQRELSLPVRDCRELARTVALAVAIALDPELTQPPPAERARDRTAAMAAPATVAPAPAVEQPVPEFSPWRGSVAARGGAAFGLAPSSMPMVAAGLAARREAWSLRLELLLGVPSQKEVPGGRVGAWLAGGGLLPCGHLGPGSLCGGAWAALYRAGSSDLEEARSQSGLWMGLGGRGSMSLFSVSDLELSLVGELLWSARRFRLSDTRTGATFWLMPRLGGTAGLELSAPL